MVLRGGCWIFVLAVSMASGCPPMSGETATEPQSETGATRPTSTESPTTGTTSSTTSPSSSSSSGESTTAGAELMRCESRCETDRDCLIDGDDLGFRCIDGLCRFPPCTGDTQCLAELSGWKNPCAGPAECAAGEACVEVDGEGRCALTPGVFACADFGLVELTRPLFMGGREVTVCGQAVALCVAGTCTTPCVDDGSCPPQLGHPFCEVQSGECECQSDQDCLGSGLPGYAQCVDGRCGCAVDSDCAGGKNVDTCYAGACGCSSDAVCIEMVFDGAPMSCQ